MTRRASHTLFSLVLLLGLCLSTLGSALGSPAAKADEQPAAPLPVSIAVGKLAPQIPSGTLSEIFTISGTLRNASTDTLKNVSTQLRVTPIPYRFDMSATYTGNWTKVAQIPDPKAKPTPAPVSLAPGQTMPWAFATSMDKLGLDNPGVYAIDVVEADSSGKVLGMLRTYLPWKPLSGHSGAKFDVALLWPLVGPPALDSVKDSSGNYYEVADTDLVQQIAPGGRLSKVLDGAHTLGAVNWVVDPDLMTSVGFLTPPNGGYQVKSGAGQNPAFSTSTDNANASAWLQAAETAIKGGWGCWSLPYADPDLASLAHANAGDGADLLKQSTGIGAPIAEEDCAAVKGAKRVLAWPADGQADQQIIDLIHQSLPSAITVLSPNGSLALPTNGILTPTGRATVTGTTSQNAVNAVVSDPALDALFTDAAQNDGADTNGLLAGQRWLAETALISREGTSQHTLLAAPPRDFTPTPGLLGAITAAAKLPAADQWFQLTDLGGLTAAKPVAKLVAPAARGVDETKLDLGPAKVAAAVTSSATFNTFLDIQQLHNRDVAPPLRTVATSWRGRPDTQAAFAAIVDNHVTDLHKQVFLSAQSQLTLSGKSGDIPVTIVNNLGTPIHVQLRVTSGLGNRLSLSPDPKSWIVAAGTQQPVNIPVKVVGNGQAITVTVHLLTPHGDDYSPPTAIIVKVSAIGIIALALMIGSAVLLVFAIGLRVYRANRSHQPARQDTMTS